MCNPEMKIQQQISILFDGLLEENKNYRFQQDRLSTIAFLIEILNKCDLEVLKIHISFQFSPQNQLFIKDSICTFNNSIYYFYSINFSVFRNLFEFQSISCMNQTRLQILKKIFLALIFQRMCKKNI
ncbi:unnamed protein product [Paramecium octaurelia]|uniref:Uncharacterized protein n=1 Tax=Paramecium octaurelia TaxID=43137 RepID=A0A8S1X432_PAROT|nr:unnamed protein product [Paramecium octaurelia]